MFHTDNWREDSGYQVTDSGGNLVFLEEASSGVPPFPADATLYERSGCLPTTSSRFRFTVTDVFGDGICCSRGLGYYQLYLDEDNVKSTDPFWASWEAEDGTLVNKGVLYSFSTRSTTFQVCPSNEVSFSLSFHVDDYPEDTSWTIERISGPGGSVQGSALGSGDNYLPIDRNLKYENENFSCLANGYYRLTFRDSLGDGFCCDFEDKTVIPGYYQYWLDGDMFRRRDDGSQFTVDVVEFLVSNKVVSFL